MNNDVFVKTCFPLTSICLLIYKLEIEKNAKKGNQGSKLAALLASGILEK